MNAHPTEMVPVVALKPHPRNYKQHPDDQIEHLMQSIREHGFYRNVVIARENTILAGHGVVMAVERMGMLGPQAVPVIRLDLDPDDPKALKILASDNEIGKFGVSDDRALAEILKDIMTADDLLGTGYDPSQLTAFLMVTRPESEIADKNAAAQWVGLPEFEQSEQPPRVVVSFRSEEDRAKFMKLIGVEFVMKKYGKTYTIWWPEKRWQDLTSLRFDFDDAAEAPQQ